MNIPQEFDEIRPYTPDELPQAFDELIADEAFRTVVAKVFPTVPFDVLAAQMRQCKTSLQFQKTFFAPLLKDLAEKTGNGIELDTSSVPDKATPHTFISNHRDIVLDSAFLSVLLLANGFPTTVEIAIGDNLLIHPWIKRMVRLNKAFIVQRSVGIREMLLSSARLARYMNFTITQKRENIWIAQREGRSKDSSDHTQDAILKMMAMGGEGSIIDRLRALNLVPTAISYEYDPCDFLKAQEFQQKRDTEGFKKSQADDLTSMGTGIYGYKGHIHFQTANCLNTWLDSIDPATPKTELFRHVAQHIDAEIYRNYRLYAGNYVAADLLHQTTEFAAHYTADEKAAFERYLNGQMAKITLPNADEPYLRERILTMYANPVFNHLSTQK